MDSNTRRTLLLILAIFTALAVSYSFVTRLKWAPDEPAHFIYIRSLAEKHAFPTISHEVTPTEESDSTHEGHQPPLYYVLMAIPFAVLKALGAANDTIWRVLRLLQIPIGLVWIWSVFALAREYFGNDKPALAAAAFVALIPMSSFMAGVINNEMLISLLFTAAMLPILRFFRAGKMGTRPAVCLGVLTGLAILTKAQGLVLIAMLLLAALAICRRMEYKGCLNVLRSVGISLGVMLVFGGWWYARSLVLHGTLMPRSLDVPALPNLAVALAYPLLFAEVVWRMAAASYVYFFLPFWLVWKGAITVMSVFGILMVLTGAMLAGFVVRMRRGGIDLRSVGMLVLAPILMWLGWVRYVLMVDKEAMIQGRLLLSVAAIIGIVWVIGFDGLLKSAKSRRIGMVVGCALMLAANVWVITSAARLYG